MNEYLNGKRAVITGISKGIGKALAQRLLASGATVEGWGLTPPDYAHERLHFTPCDVSQESQVLAALAATLSRGPRIDFLVNNAGFGYFNPIETFDMEQWDRMMQVNVRGAVLASKHIVPLMKENQSGHIVNVSSIAGKTGMPQGEGYNTSKFALTGFSDCLFSELRSSGIKVTTVFPGSTATHFFDEIPGYESSPWMMNPAEVAEMIAMVLNTSPNFVVREIEMRPLKSK